MRKRVYIAYTGGTIGMRRSASGYRPHPGYLAQLMAAIPELRHPSLPHYQIHEYQPLLDSAEMAPNDWLKIAADIADHYRDYDGFLILHGTDTMAYTASVLPFLLGGTGKPVVLTGSQVPLCEVRNDARDNLITALVIAAQFPIPEVLLCFGSKLLRGNRAVKVDADGFDAFDSPNFPAIGSVGIEITVNRDLVLPTPERATIPRPELKSIPRVGALRLFPGISAELVEGVLKPPLQGLVLESYGVGNGPTRDRGLMAVLAEADARGVVIVNCGQCLKGTVSQDSYATGSALAQAGVVSGFDLTTEAALTKLFCLLSRNLPPTTVKSLMQTSLFGELTPTGGAG
ncbi:MAG: L-asparaginase 1 [Syntrophobacteraceae bacterium CG2_30_61_12]|nr:MAG: L-asparaginase 1 [Syntrophobacteraceae bacterium CG2_30_61_12]